MIKIKRRTTTYAANTVAKSGPRTRVLASADQDQTAYKSDIGHLSTQKRTHAIGSRHPVPAHTHACTRTRTRTRRRTHKHTRTSTHMHAHTYTHMHTHTHAHIRTHAHTHKHRHRHTQIQHTHTHTETTLRTFSTLHSPTSLSHCLNMTSNSRMDSEGERTCASFL